MQARDLLIRQGGQGACAYTAEAALLSRAENIRLAVNVINAGKKAPKCRFIYD
jgi:hypothetical protein